MVSNIVDDCSFWVEERSKKPRNWRKIEHNKLKPPALETTDIDIRTRDDTIRLETMNGFRPNRSLNDPIGMKVTNSATESTVNSPPTCNELSPTFPTAKSGIIVNSKLIKTKLDMKVALLTDRNDLSLNNRFTSK